MKYNSLDRGIYGQCVKEIGVSRWIYSLKPQSNTFNLICKVDNFNLLMGEGGGCR